MCKNNLVRSIKYLSKQIEEERAKQQEYFNNVVTEEDHINYVLQEFQKQGLNTSCRDWNFIFNLISKIQDELKLAEVIKTYPDFVSAETLVGYIKVEDALKYLSMNALSPAIRFYAVNRIEDESVFHMCYDMEIDPKVKYAISKKCTDINFGIDRVSSESTDDETIKHKISYLLYDVMTNSDIYGVDGSKELYKLYKNNEYAKELLSVYVGVNLYTEVSHNPYLNEMGIFNRVFEPYGKYANPGSNEWMWEK